MPCGGPDTPISTDSAVRNAAQDVFDLASAKLRVDGRDRGDSAERPIGSLKPAQSSLTISEEVIGDGNNPSEPIQTVGLVARQTSAAATTLQTSRGEVECAGELLEGQAGSTHQFFDDGRAKALADGLTQIAITGQVPSQRPLTTQLVDYGSELVYHSVAYDSDKWRTGQSKGLSPLCFVDESSRSASSLVRAYDQMFTTGFLIVEYA